MVNALFNTDQGVLYNPGSPDFIKDPYAVYKHLRDEDPLHWSPAGMWVVSRHADAKFILKDKRFGHDFLPSVAKRHGQGAVNEACFQSIKKWMLFLDPPSHTRIRNLVVKAFNTNSVNSYSGQIQGVVNDILSLVKDNGKMDLITQFAYPIPVHSLCIVFGIPKEDWHLFMKPPLALARTYEPQPMNRQELDAANEDVIWNNKYFEKLAKEKRVSPGKDLVTSLVEVESEGDKLTMEELTANLRVIYDGGFGTTFNFIGLFVLALEQHPEIKQALIKDPSLIPQAIDEGLRYCSPVHITKRQALEDVELRGKLIKKGDVISILLASANHDERAYDDASEFDITRKYVKPMSFGGGIHYCVGAQLGKVEAEIAIRTLLGSIPNYRVTNMDDLSWRKTVVMRGLESLQLEW